MKMAKTWTHSTDAMAFKLEKALEMARIVPLRSDIIKGKLQKYAGAVEAQQDLTNLAESFNKLYDLAVSRVFDARGVD